MATHGPSGLKLHLSSQNTTGYKGVAQDHRRGTFMAQEQYGGKHVHIGTFDTAIEAAEKVTAAHVEPKNLSKQLTESSLEW